MVQLKEKRGGKYFCIFISINILRWDISDNSSILPLSPDNMRYKNTSVTLSSTAKTTQNYNTRNYSTTLSSAISHIILTVKVMICVPRDFPTYTRRKTKHKSHDELTIGGFERTSQFSSFNYLVT